MQDANLNDAQGEQQHLAQYAEACVLMETLIWAVSRPPTIPFAGCDTQAVR